GHTSQFGKLDMIAYLEELDDVTKQLEWRKTKGMARPKSVDVLKIHEVIGTKGAVMQYVHGASAAAMLSAAGGKTNGKTRAATTARADATDERVLDVLEIQPAGTRLSLNTVYGEIKKQADALIADGQVPDFRYSKSGVSDALVRLRTAGQANLTT